jgi:hypothetical protein
MNRYEVFQYLLDFVAVKYEVTDADMNNYCGEMQICGKQDGQTIEITVKLKKEEKKDD